MGHLFTWGLHVVVVCISLLALLVWPQQYPLQGGHPAHFRYAVTPNNAQWGPQEALSVLFNAPVTAEWNSRFSSDPVWTLHTLAQAEPGQERTLEFPSRHATRIECWNASTLSAVGSVIQGTSSAGVSRVRSGWGLTLDPQVSFVLCRSTFIGPAHMTVKLWDSQDLSPVHNTYLRNAGLLDGGMLVLALFILFAGFINRDSQYVLFASWLVLNLRVAALSAGWDDQWLGHVVPYDWLMHLRPVTLAAFYTVTLQLFLSLFSADLDKLGFAHPVTLARWSCPPLLILSLLLPYSVFFPLMWLATAGGAVLLVYLLAQIWVRTRSRVAIWFTASIVVVLVSCVHEMVVAALGLSSWAADFNAGKAALLSSLLASLAVAELIREEHMQRLSAQAKLQQTYNALPVGLFTLDARGQFLNTNPTLAQILSRTQQQLRQTLWSDLFSHEDWQKLANNATHGEPVEITVARPLQASGKLQHLMVKAQLADGKIEGTLQDISEKNGAMEHLRFLANHDPLTKVLNRRGIESALSTSLDKLTPQHTLAVAYLDLDRFKLINDLYGHTAGDAVLQQVCSRVQHALDPNMHLGRVGGDEFLLLMPDTPLAQARQVCGNIVHALANTPYRVGERAFHVRCSIGLIEVAAGSYSKDVVSAADRACREAKRSATSNLVVYESSSRLFSDHEAELQLVERLATGARIEGLFLEMQPIMSLMAPYDSLNFEVLLRMRDAEGNRIPTDRLIKAGENAGRMGVIDRWVLSSTLDWLKLNDKVLAHNQFVCMNLSGASLNDERFKEDVYAMLDTHRALAPRICLEITESVALNDTGTTRIFIDRIRGYGAKVALDDFGAGYTSFNYLKDLPADLLKIDGSFIVNMNQHPANIAIVEAIVSLARTLNMQTIAEWAEDSETVATLAEIGVDYVQGFIVAKPQTPRDLLNATSSASFILDPQLQLYLEDLKLTDDELNKVDMVLGASRPATA